MFDALVFNPHRTMISKGEWIEGFKQDTIHDSLTVSEPPKGRPLVLITESMAVTNSGGVTQAQGHTAGSLTGQTGSESTAMPNLALISSSEGFPARMSQWPATGPVLGEHVAVSGLSSIGCCANCGHDGRSLRMFPASLVQMAVEISSQSSWDWKTSGMGGPTQFWTRGTSESRNAAAACSLSDVLETRTLPRKYWLSAKAAEGILRRAAKRGKELPTALMKALQALSEGTTAT